MPAREKLETRNQLSVIFRGEEIGILTWSPQKRTAYFFFSKAYFNNTYDLCPITHPKNNPETRFAIYGNLPGDPDQQVRIYQGLPPFIADSLPDRWGNAVFDRWFRQNNIPESAKTPIAKLSFIGNRAMGALEFRPIINPSYDKDRVIEISELYKEALAVEDELERKTVATGQATIQNIAALGTSPGGSRKKAVVSISPDGIFHSGKTHSEPGWRNCLIKFNDPRYTLAEIEKTYYDLATAAGIPMMKSELIEIDGVKHFLTDRFDRKGGIKFMTQTLAAMNPEARTYEDLFRTCRLLGIPEKEKENLFRQTVFNFLLGNTDDHVKNFSFLMEEDNTWHLAPAYDMTFIIADNGIQPEKNHCMSLSGKFTDVSEKDLITLARENDIKAPEKIIRKIREISLLFEEKAEENGINSYYKEMIAEHLDNMERPNPHRVNRSSSFEVNGIEVKDFHFEMTPKGNIHILATIADKTRKMVITPKKPLHTFILENGFNSMPLQIKQKIIEQYLLYLGMTIIEK